MEKRDYSRVSSLALGASVGLALERLAESGYADDD